MCPTTELQSIKLQDQLFEWDKYERVGKKARFLWENEANERALFERDVINPH